jgi:hypothetical protein
MSILIKKMEKPKTCALCPFREIRYKSGYYNYEHCSALNMIFNEDKLDIDPYKERLSDCPLIEIPTPHGRLIDERKALLTDLEIFMCDGSYKDALKLICEKLDNAPTILEAEE